MFLLGGFDGITALFVGREKNACQMQGRRGSNHIDANERL